MTINKQGYNIDGSNVIFIIKLKNIYVNMEFGESSYTCVKIIQVYVVIS